MLDFSSIDAIRIPDGNLIKISTPAVTIWRKKFKAVFDGNGSTSGSTSDIVQKYELSFQIPECGYAKSGSQFIEWNTKADGNGLSYIPGTSYNMPNKGVTFYAKWEIRSYTVTFKDYNGTVLKTQTVNYNNNATPPANPTRTGYSFSGWSGSYTNVTSDRIITALYVEDIPEYSTVTQSISISAKGGGSEKSQTISLPNTPCEVTLNVTISGITTGLGRAYINVNGSSTTYSNNTSVYSTFNNVNSLTVTVNGSRKAGPGGYDITVSMSGTATIKYRT